MTEGYVSFPFWDTHRFMMKFKVDNVQTVMEKIKSKLQFQCTEKENIITVRLNGLYIELDTLTNQVSVIAVHEKVKPNSYLFKEIFV